MPCGEPDAWERARPVRRAGASRPPRASSAWRLASDPTSRSSRAACSSTAPFAGPEDLATQMLAFVEHYNLTAQPFAWTYTGKVLAA